MDVGIVSLEAALSLPKEPAKSRSEPLGFGAFLKAAIQGKRPSSGKPEPEVQEQQESELVGESEPVAAFWNLQFAPEIRPQADEVQEGESVEPLGLWEQDLKSTDLSLEQLTAAVPVPADGGQEGNFLELYGMEVVGEALETEIELTELPLEVPLEAPPATALEAASDAVASEDQGVSQVGVSIIEDLPAGTDNLGILEGETSELTAVDLLKETYPRQTYGSTLEAEPKAEVEVASLHTRAAVSSRSAKEASTTEVQLVSPLDRKAVLQAYGKLSNLQKSLEASPEISKLPEEGTSLEEEAEVSAVRGATSEAWDESIGTSDGKDLVAAEKSRFEVRRTGDVQKEKQPLNLEFEVSFAEALKELGARELSGSTPSRVQGDRALEVLEYDQFFEVLAGRLTSASEEEQSVNIRLYPKELGELKISVSVKADVVQLKLETETVLSQRIIEEQLPVLKKALESQGLQLGEFSLGTNFFNHQGSYETRLELASEFSKLMSLNGRSEEGIPSENPPEVAYTKPKDGLVDYRV